MEHENKIKLFEKEIELKMGNDFVNSLTNAIVDSQAMKKNINTETNRAFIDKRTKKKKR